MMGHMANIQNTLQGMPEEKVAGGPYVEGQIPQNPEGWEGAIRQFGAGRMNYNDPEQRKWIDKLPDDMMIDRGPDSGTGPGESVIIRMKTDVPMSQKEGGTKLAGDVVGMGRKEPIQIWNVDKPAGYEAQTPEQAGAVAKGVMGGKVHVLTPGDKRSELELTRLAMEGPQSDKPVTYSVSGKLGEHVSGPVDATDLHHALKILQIMNMFSGAVGTTLKGEQK
jgi:hypothetical protein